MDGGPPSAPLERSFSQQSATSSKSQRSSTVRGSRRKLVSQASSSASSINASDKSLTSFPSFSPGSPNSTEAGRDSLLLPPDVFDGAAATLLFKKPEKPRKKSTSPKPSSSSTAGGGTASSSIVESLTATPALSPHSTLLSPFSSATAAAAAAGGAGSGLGSAAAAAAARTALFDDAPALISSKIPGSLHLADDEHVERLIARHGAVRLVRQLAEDLAQRDAQISALRIRASDRERALRKIARECGLSGLDLETRLRAVEQEQRLNGGGGSAARRVSDLMSDAMAESVSATGASYYGFPSPMGLGGEGDGQATIRAPSGSMLPPPSSLTDQDGAGGNNGNKGTLKYIKDYIWGGGGSRKSSRASSINGDVVSGIGGIGGRQQEPQTVIRAPAPGDRRRTLPDDLFSPLDTESLRSSSRASSINNGASGGGGGGRKTSAPFATLVRMVAGGGAVASSKDGADPRGRTNSTPPVSGGGGGGGSLRTPSVSSQRTNGSARAVSTHVPGPKALMSMRRGTGANSAAAATAVGIRSRPEERWDTMGSSPVGESSARGAAESLGPVEMDKILPLEGQPPTLNQTYHHYRNGSEDLLTDRFGFIYDQRRKKRQRAGSQLVQRVQQQQQQAGASAGIAEIMLSNGKNGKPSLAPITVATDADIGGSSNGTPEDRPGSPSSIEEVREAGAKTGSRWYDYLKVVTFQAGTERTTELLSDTPAMSAPGIEVTEGGGTTVVPAASGGGGAGGLTVDSQEHQMKSPVIVAAAGFVPAASIATSALDTRDPTAVASVTGGGGGSSEQQQASSGPTSSSTTTSVGTFVKEDTEPVKQLLEQLNGLHDALQKKRMDRWNEFQRKVRAERRKDNSSSSSNNNNSTTNGGASSSSGIGIGGDSTGASLDAPRPLRSMPEARLADGELIGVADLGNKGKVGRAKWSEFRSLVLGGIPVVLRAKVWAECSGAIDLRIPGYYDDLVAASSSSSSSGHQEDNPDVVNQIRADINRTLTDNIFFRKGQGVQKLHEVLLAYSRRNPDVGYCQGMNLIAANLLLITPSAEDAFWLLAAIVERILPAGYYDHSLLASRADQQVLRQYVGEILPRLSAHFDALAIDLETMTFQWFLSVFTDCLSAEALFRVWDAVLCLAPDGSTFLFQVALALLKLNEPQLLQCGAPAAVYTYINHQMTNHAISIDGLIQASEGLRRHVRREDVAVRRERAVRAEREGARQREEMRRVRQEKLEKLRQDKQKQQKQNQSQQSQSTSSVVVATNTNNNNNNNNNNNSLKAAAAVPVVDAVSPTVSATASAASSQPVSRSGTPAPVHPLPLPDSVDGLGVW